MIRLPALKKRTRRDFPDDYWRLTATPASKVFSAQGRTASHTRPRVQRAPGIPCVPLSFEGEEFLQDLGAMRGEIAKAYQVVIACDLSAVAQRAKAEGG